MNDRKFVSCGLAGVLFCCLLVPGAGMRAQAPASGRAAEGLVSDAARMLQNKDMAGARAKLDAARTADPNQAGLWAGYAALAAQDGRMDEALEDLKHELANHPKDLVNYRNLASVQFRQKKPKEAIATLQQLLTIAPEDVNATQAVVNLQMADKDYAGAEVTLRGLVARRRDPQAETLLATALLRQGKKEEAGKLLSGIVNTSNDPGLLNDAAFAMADDGLDLALAEKASRRAVEMLDQQSMAGAMNSKPLVRSEMTVSTWDTLGWTLFLEGKAADAEPWIRAAWSHGLAAEPGYHLGMVLEKLGQPAKALPVYQMAAYADAGSNHDAVVAKINARIAALGKMAAALPDPKAALQGLRVFRVPGANSLNGTATVEFEMAAGGASNAVIVKDDPKGTQLTSVETSLYAMNFKTGFPPGSRARIVRRGVLMCRAGKPCEIALMSTRAAVADSN